MHNRRAADAGQPPGQTTQPRQTAPHGHFQGHTHERAPAARIPTATLTRPPPAPSHRRGRVFLTRPPQTSRGKTNAGPRHVPGPTWPAPSQTRRSATIRPPPLTARRRHHTLRTVLHLTLRHHTTRQGPAGGRGRPDTQAQPDTHPHSPRPPGSRPGGDRSRCAGASRAPGSRFAPHACALPCGTPGPSPPAPPRHARDTSTGRGPAPRASPSARGPAPKQSHAARRRSLTAPTGSGLRPRPLTRRPRQARSGNPSRSWGRGPARSPAPAPKRAGAGCA